MPGATAITLAASSDDGATTTFTAAGHGITTGESVTIYGTTDYNGTYTATYLTADTFKVTKAFKNNQTGSVGNYASKTYTTTADSYDANYYVIRNGETKSFTLSSRLTGGNDFQKAQLGTFK